MDGSHGPGDDASFDAVLSTYGVMFAPHQLRAAAELVRICEPGGKIAPANWTPEGFLGDFFAAVGRYLPPPAGLPSPFLWGTEGGLSALFGSTVRVLAAERKHFVFRYQSAAHFIQVFRSYYGPTYHAFKALDDQGKKDLDADLTRLLACHDRGDARALKVPGEYLEVVLDKR